MPKEIEDVYQKVSQLEHVLLRPDTYIGSVEYTEKTPMWVYDKEEQKLVQRDIQYVPGLYKIFDEILVNAADNKQRDPKMNVIKVNINKEKNEISVYNNGKGIPIVMHKKEHMYVPELIFGTLLTSSNYNDDERKVTGGRNGYGAKLCNIFSKKFTLETQSSAQKKHFKQTWINNMKKEDEAIIKDASKSEDFTKITFVPDLRKFKMEELDDDIIALLSRRAFDVAGSVPGVKVYLNGELLPCKDFKSYVEQYTKDREANGEILKVAFDKPHERWDVALTVSDKGFQQVSFANSIATTKGGRHVDYVVDQITASLIETIKKKIGKGGINIKPFQLKNHLWVFVNALIENPTFDSQTKETMTLQAKDFGSKFKVSDKFLKEVVSKCGIVDSVMSWVRFKQQEQQDKKCSSKKSAKLKGFPKLEDANDAGTKNSHLCTLILTEGDSAKSLAIAGLGVIGRDRYGVFPLRGKMLNVRECAHAQLVKNAEVEALLKIIGLRFKMEYTTDEEMKTLRYGKIMIMTDQDQDGSHIKGLIINFIHYHWPNLIRNNFLEEFITPIVKVTKGSNSESFYSLPEYMEWRQNTDNWNSYTVKYYKGLGTSLDSEVKEYFTDIIRHRIKFQYSGQPDDEAIDLAFSKKKIEERKTWLTQWMNERRDRREQGKVEDYLYDRDTHSITFFDFINKELVLFSNVDNERSIPSLVDGLKPGQRKIMFTCFERAEKKEIKVAQLAGSVGEMSAYHHGEQSLMMTIINLAQDFVGSNNINLLLPNGQFGTRLQGGKDAASPRYIFTQLNPVTKSLFPSDDEHVLRFLYEENQRIEPEWYCPIIPLVLVNGAEGIGTGWSTKVPNYDPKEIVANIRRLIRGEEQKPMTPWYRKFTGTICKLDDTRYVCSGEIAIIDDKTIEITELPVKSWTQTYKENVLAQMLETSAITDFKEYHTEKSVKFVVKMKADQLAKFKREGLHKVFKLQNVINTTSMVLFDAAGCLRKFDTPEEICKEFFDTRKQIYIDRKNYLEGMLGAQSDCLAEKVRLILMNINVQNQKKKQIIDQLIANNFKPDPVKAWKDEQLKKKMERRGDAVDENEEDGAEETENDDSQYEYLLETLKFALLYEEQLVVFEESKAKKKQLLVLQEKSWSDLWTDDLKKFMKALNNKDAKDKKEFEKCLEMVKETLPDGEAGRTRAETQLPKGIHDALPSKNALRVAPTLDAMKEKYETTPKKEKDSNASPEERSPHEPKDPNKPKAVRKKKAEQNESGDVRDNSGDEGSSQMTNGSSSQKVARKGKTEKEPKAKKTAAKPKASKSTPKKKKSKKEYDSDVSESEEDELSDVGSDDDEEIVESLPKRENAPRRAAAVKRTTYAIDDDASEDLDESGEEFNMSGSDDNDEPSKPPPKRDNARRNVVAKKTKYIDDDEESDADVISRNPSRVIDSDDDF